MKDKATIGLVDDDPGMLRALGRLLKEEGFEICAYTSATEFLERRPRDALDCLILDVSMPSVSGLELQEKLQERAIDLPIIFLTGQGNIPMSVRAIKAGAVDFLTKPVDDRELLAAVGDALEKAERLREEAALLAEGRARLESLTARELEVLRHVITGKLNKQIAGDLAISEQTVKVHRMRITEKMGMPSVAELVRVCERLGVAPAPS